MNTTITTRTYASLRDELAILLREQAGLDAADAVTDDMLLRMDNPFPAHPSAKGAPGFIGMDNLDQIEMVMAVEDAFGIIIPEAEAEKLCTFGQLVDYVAQRANITKESNHVS